MTRQAERVAPPTLPDAVEAPQPPAAGWRWAQTVLAMVLAAVLAIIAVVALQHLTASAPPAPVGPTAIPQRLIARGQVRAVAQARVGTIGGGVLSRLVVEVGDPVTDQQELARVRGLNATEVVTSPLRGTVTTVLARLGDTLAPGAIIATVGDLSRLQIETTDVDEFLIARVRPNQLVAGYVEALERELPGRVRSVSLQPVVDTTGDEHYPVTIDLIETPEQLRPGMTVRIRFLE